MNLPISAEKHTAWLEEHLQKKGFACCVLIDMFRRAYMAPQMFVVVLDVPRVQSAEIFREAWVFLSLNSGLPPEQLHVQIVPTEGTKTCGVG